MKALVFQSILIFLIAFPLVFRFAGTDDFRARWDYKYVAVPLAWGALWATCALASVYGKALHRTDWEVLPLAIMVGIAFHYLTVFLLKSFNIFGMSFSPARDDQHRRGTTLLTAGQVAQEVKRRKFESRFVWGGVPVPHNLETRSFLLAGSPGTGKSQAIQTALDAMTKTDARGIIADTSAQFLRRYSRPDSLIFNPFDSRSVKWSPFAEMTGQWDAASIAKSIIPDSEGSSAEWNSYAQTFIEALLLRLFESGTGTNGELFRLACIADVTELRPIVAGTPAQPMCAEGNERTFGCVRSIVGTYLKPYQHLDPETGSDGFSVKNFVQSGKGWLFLTYRQDQRAALAPLISAVLDVASRALLTTKPDLNHRFWFVLDEFPLLGKVGSVVELLTNGRKHGAACLIGLQTVSQLRSAYGRETAQTILACLGTWLVLRCNDAETASYMAQHAGKEEVKRTNQSGGTSDSGTSENWSQHVLSQDVLLPSQIQNWPDLAGVLNLAGDLPICSIVLALVQEMPDRCEDFVNAPRKVEQRLAAECLADPDKATTATNERVRDEHVVDFG